MLNNYYMKNNLFIILILVSFSVNAQMLSTSGHNIVNSNNEEVLLRGVGLGGWMLQEGYMMNSNGAADTQHEFKAKLIELIGETETQQFYNNWLENFVTEEDLDSIASFGYNSVRLGMHYNLFTLPIEEEPVPGENTWLTKGFEMVDELLDWCEARQIYLILDLHAAPGGQGYDEAISDYDPTKPSLWESDFNKSKTVALWAQLADRYKDEPWIGGYDLINETNWNLGTFDLRNLYVQITNAIRAVDTNHILFIEGNWFANDFTGLTPPWDSNMVYSFHKYWTYNDTASIQWVLDLRNQYNVPLWCGESGENSNVWYTEAIKLFEDNNIGWSWWPYKRIETTVAPFSIASNPNYESIINYWRGESSAPSVSNAIQGLTQLTNDLLVQNTTFYKDVVDAQLRQPLDQTHIPYSDHNIPGVIHLSDYDLGTNGIAYSDSDYANYSLNTGEFAAWNSGWTYRNDGVDIQTNNDSFNSNGFHIGYIKDQEWLNYTVNIDQSGFYNLITRYASNQSFGKIKFYLDDADITEVVTLYNSGGWSNFTNRIINNIYLPSGTHTLKLKIIGDVEFNISSLEFSESTDSTPSFQALGAISLEDERSIKLSLNHPLNNQVILLEQFDVKVNSVSKPIESIEIDPNNDRVLLIKLDDFLYYEDDITIDHIGEILLSIFNDALPELINFPVVNELPSRFYIPGKIEAEDYNNESGLGTENTSDTGGGLNIGWTDAGDYAEYPVYVNKTGIYDISLRTAAQNQQGLIEFELINSATTQSIGSFTTPVTGGWQSWQTSTFEATLDHGVYILKMKVLQSGFNLNWFEFVYSDQNLSVEDIELELGDIVKVYPNPVKDVLNINVGSHQIKNVNIYDVNGRLILENNINHHSSNVQLKISQINSGIYLLSIETNNGILYKRLIKQ